MAQKLDRNKLRKKRHYRTRSKMVGTMERPRLNVFRSNKHIYAQIINDVTGHTLVSASTLSPEFEQVANAGTGLNVDAAKIIGKLVAEKALAQGINQVIFDRGGYKYHGRVAALASAAREAGLKF